LRAGGLLRDAHDLREGGAGIFFVSHVGGHKFSANMLVYRREGTLGTRVAEEEDGKSEAGKIML
jgi:Sucrase/ferredoxin-like